MVYLSTTTYIQSIIFSMYSKVVFIRVLTIKNYFSLDYTYYYFKGDISSKYNDVPLIVKDITPRDNDGNPGDMTLRFSW